MIDILKKRLDAVRAALKTAEVDAVLLTEIVNIAYVTGFTGSSAYAIIGPDSALIVTDSRYILRAREECPLFEAVIGQGGYLEALKKWLEERGPVKALGFESANLTVSQFEHFRKEVPNVAWKATKNIVEDVRAVKDSSEIRAIRHAVAIAEEAFLSVKPLLKPGITEAEFAIELEYTMRRLGAEAVAFEPIVASGPNSARPHHTPGKRLMAENDWVTVDWGAKVDGYCSDITRTILLGPASKVTEEQRKVYGVVLEAQRRALAAIAPGKTGKEIDALARDHIKDAGYGDYFGHSLGHGLGRVVHDGSGFSTKSDDVILKPGMVLTVEPGIYIENWGGMRIEEDIVVTETGCEILTYLPNELEIL